MRGGHWRDARAGRLYGGLLRVYPAAFRARFGRDMRATFAEDYQRARGRKRRGRAAFWIRTAFEAVCYGLSERFDRRPAIRIADSSNGGATMVWLPVRRASRIDPTVVLRE